MNQEIQDQYYIELMRAPTEDARIQVLRSIFHFKQRGKAVDSTTANMAELVKVAKWALSSFSLTHIPGFGA